MEPPLTHCCSLLDVENPEYDFKLHLVLGPSCENFRVLRCVGSPPTPCCSVLNIKSPRYAFILHQVLGALIWEFWGFKVCGATAYPVLFLGLLWPGVVAFVNVLISMHITCYACSNTWWWLGQLIICNSWQSIARWTAVDHSFPKCICTCPGTACELLFSLKLLTWTPHLNNELSLQLQSPCCSNMLALSMGNLSNLLTGFLGCRQRHYFVYWNFRVSCQIWSTSVQDMMDLLFWARSAYSGWIPPQIQNSWSSSTCEGPSYGLISMSWICLWEKVIHRNLYRSRADKAL